MGSKYVQQINSPRDDPSEKQKLFDPQTFHTTFPWFTNICQELCMFKEESGVEQFPQLSFQLRDMEDELSQVHCINTPQRNVPTDTYIIGNAQNGIFEE